MTKKSILVVEDDTDIRRNMEEFLEFEGYEPLVASNGREALALLAQAKQLPAVILLDLMMPVMDGPQFRLEQRKDARISHIPVVIMSAAADVEIRRLQLGAVTFIKKPLNIDELGAMLRQY